VILSRLSNSKTLTLHFHFSFHFVLLDKYISEFELRVTKQTVLFIHTESLFCIL